MFNLFTFFVYVSVIVASGKPPTVRQIKSFMETNKFLKPFFMATFHNFKLILQHRTENQARFLQYHR